MKRSKLAILTLVLISGAAYSQSEGPPPDRLPPPGGPPAQKDWVFGPHIIGTGPFMHPWKVVTGAPYSATATEHFFQSLVGGNTIDRTTTAQVARDSQGRTYRQESLPGGPWASQANAKPMIFITDPVAHYSYVLHPDKKLAIRRALRTPPEAEQAQSRPSHDAFFGTKPGDNATETDLGTKDIPGVGTAEGKAVTHTIAAGQIGNAQPIISTSESWYSPDLQIVVASKHNDPRMGQSSYTLSNIQRGEPNASLFQVPSDYTIQDESRLREQGHPGPPE